MTMTRHLGLLAALLAACAQGQDEAQEEVGQEASKKAAKDSARLAPTLKYPGLHSFLHGGVGSPDKVPKVLLLLDSADADTPEWYTSAAMGFKDGKKYSVRFGVVKADGEKVAQRFGLAKTDEVPQSGMLVVCLVDGEGGGKFARYKGSLVAGGGTAVRAVKTFVKDAINEQGDDVELEPLPPFPPPDVPRKQASVALIELTYDNLPTHCFGGSKSLCVIALLPRDTPRCPDALSELARRHRNDPVQFAWLRAHKQEEFVSGFGLGVDALPRLVAVKPGKRSRFALLEGGVLDPGEMARFVDRILGGDMQFQKLSPLPELEPPYLQTADGDEAEAEAAERPAGGDDSFAAEDKVEL